jgi:AbrB family looped-hinge helix DNA binding protein
MTVTVSPKYQVVIPSGVRESLGILPGMKVPIFLYQNRIEFVPVRALKSMRGFLSGISTDVVREDDRL